MSLMGPPSAISRILLHFALFSLAMACAGVFFAAFLLRQGLSPAQVFLALGALLGVRFSLRPAALVLARRFGSRATLVAGTTVSAVGSLLLGAVTGLDGTLALFVVVSGLGDAIYWTSFHACFALVGTASRLGRQTSLRQIAFIGANIVGPPLGGLVLTWSPLAAFGIAAAIRLLAILPLLGLPPMTVERLPPPNIWRTARFGALVFATDGWILAGAGMAWAMIAFVAMGSRFDTLGLAMSAAAVAGALATWLLGRLIDLGHGFRAVLVNLVAGLFILGAQAMAGFDPGRVIFAMLAAAALGGLATPAIMTAVYAEAKAASCPFRFQFATEGGWDAGGAAACLFCAMLLGQGAPLHLLILSAAPALFVQAALLRGGYSRQAATALAVAE